MPSTPKAKHDHHTLKFPEGFLWGAATSAHQVEGDNTNNDWWAWEQTRPEELRSGQAANQYHLYEQDFALAKELGHNAHRLSIEWSRIEPEEGVWDKAEIEHYQAVLKSLKDKNLRVMLTLNHFTLPLWLAKKGGYESFSFPRYFNRFVKKVTPELKDYVDLWITINEPGVIGYMSYLMGLWPPQKKSKWLFLKVMKRMAKAHNKAYKTIHREVPHAWVGIAHNVGSYNSFHHHSLMELLTQWGFDMVGNHLIYKLTGMSTHDFLGINYYFNTYISFNGQSRFPSPVDVATTKKDTSDLGWEIYPQGMYEVLMDFSDYHKPIYITENGLASTNDDRRSRFLVAYLQEIYHAISSGVEVKGYFHWSLIDNFEWHEGLTPRFGLIEVDYSSQRRLPRPSALVYKDIIEHNGIPHKLLRFLGHTVQAMEVLFEEAKQLRLTKEDLAILERAAEEEKRADQR